MINENFSPKREKGCLMVSVEIPGFDEMQLKIASEDLYLGETEEDKEKYGLEHTPHVTVCYGFPYDTTWDDLKKYVPESAQDFDDGIVTGIGLFENEKYDVLKYNVYSSKLAEANHAIMTNFDVENDYAGDYKAHATIAYLKPGKGKKYEKPLLDKLIRLKVKNYILSNKDGEEQEI